MLIIFTELSTTSNNIYYMLRGKNIVFIEKKWDFLATKLFYIRNVLKTSNFKLYKIDISHSKYKIISFFIKFSNFYWFFIQNFSQISTLLIIILEITLTNLVEDNFINEQNMRDIQEKCKSKRNKRVCKMNFFQFKLNLLWQYWIKHLKKFFSWAIVIENVILKRKKVYLFMLLITF